MTEAVTPTYPLQPRLAGDRLGAQAASRCRAQTGENVEEYGGACLHFDFFVDCISPNRPPFRGGYRRKCHARDLHERVNISTGIMHSAVLVLFPM